MMQHFERWGMEVHSGNGTAAKSKSEFMFCPAPAHTYTDAATFDGADLSDVQLPGGRSMHFVQRFCYLGDIVASDCGDAYAVDARIESAGKAFGALRKCVFACTYVSPAAKVAAYEALVLSILLYGAESWCLTEHLYDRLRVFHARCLRCICYVSRKHTREHHISTESLMKQLGVDAIDFYVAQRQLGWAGHVRRMDFDRLPRRMLSSWVPHKRPPGAPRMTYGRSLGKALDVFDLDHSKWHELAADRCAWRAMLASGTPQAAFRALPPQPAAPPLALGRARRSSAAQTDAAIAASARGDALTTTLGYVQRRAVLRDITNHI